MHHVGRFAFVLPEGWRPAGRSQSLYHVDASTHPVAPEDARRFLESRLALARGEGAAGAERDPVEREFELEPGVPAFWHRASPSYLDRVAIDVVRPADDHVLLLVREADRGQEATAERLVRRVLAAYVPGARTGFGVGQGALVMDPSRNETARITFSRGSPPDLRITLETGTVGEVSAASEGDVDEDEAQAKTAGGSITVLRNERRAIAGLDGLELRIAVTVPESPRFLRYSWRFRGTPLDPRRPRIDAVGTGPDARREELESAWERLLETLTAVPES